MTGKVVEVTAAQLYGTTAAHVTPENAPEAVDGETLAASAASVYGTTPVIPAETTAEASAPDVDGEAELTGYTIVVTQLAPRPLVAGAPAPWPPDDMLCVAEAPDLPDCRAEAATPSEAVYVLRYMIEQWCGRAKAEGRPSPTPSFRYRRASSSVS